VCYFEFDFDFQLKFKFGFEYDFVFFSTMALKQQNLDTYCSLLITAFLGSEKRPPQFRVQSFKMLFLWGCRLSRLASYSELF